MGAIVLIARLAHVALQASPDLRTNTNPVTHLHGGGLGTQSNDLANHFMTHTDGEAGLTPAAGDGVDITAANTARLNGDLDIALTERLRFELNYNRPESQKSWRAHGNYDERSPIPLAS